MGPSFPAQLGDQFFEERKQQSGLYGLPEREGRDLALDARLQSLESLDQWIPAGFRVLVGDFPWISGCFGKIPCRWWWTTIYLPSDVHLMDVSIELMVMIRIDVLFGYTNHPMSIWKIHISKFDSWISESDPHLGRGFGLAMFDY